MKVLIAFLAASVYGLADAAYSPQECVAGFLGLGFDFQQIHRYPEFFRDDSVVVLAQAGEYKGAEAIKEYIRFATDSSPYFLEGYIIDTADPLLPYMSPSTGLCDFLLIQSHHYTSDPEITNGDEFNVAWMARLTFSIPDNYIVKTHIYYKIDFLGYYFGTVVNTKQTREYICETMKEDCPETFALNGKMKKKKCMKRLKKLPILTNGIYADGNDRGCRSLHTAMVKFDKNHCPHISFEPQ
eukprot:CAMPEP_0183299666 /NCGR_PEP_ID=MMETSP0160_2-20130417/6337_1 /TAXON_ID=2839 ORGANISM="Odontella Sinensis, Strain Grunow 1884" /NCGR_SAMPLE_ID=MMETSP0160_2 /ASSEMBLY_ACC=CAM_ASM_000250 /LENGTH=240 /DNA_ID=CAMNT_0025461951 /DNA_START=45 /DNA_END=764 /DNA_ORIENTATION=-